MEREVGGGIGMGNTCKPVAVSFQCMTKSTTNKKKKRGFFFFSLRLEEEAGRNQRVRTIAQLGLRIQ